jgi:hypothetical protein
MEVLSDPTCLPMRMPFINWAAGPPHLAKWTWLSNPFVMPSTARLKLLAFI